MTRYTWSGHVRSGTARTGSVELERLPSVGTLVATRYRKGWRDLIVRAPDGTVVGRIERIDGRRRVWWAES